MGSAGRNAESAGGVPPLGDSEDIRDVSLASWVGGMGVVIGGGCLGGGEAVENDGIHLEVAGYHF